MMEEMLGFLSKQRQILLYSATFPLSVQKFMVLYPSFVLKFTKCTLFQAGLLKLQAVMIHVEREGMSP